MFDKEKIVKDFEPLIKSSIKKYFANNDSFEDAFQDGVLKILQLLETFDGSGKISLECYLKYQIKYFYMNKFSKQKAKYENQISANIAVNNEDEKTLMDDLKDETDIEKEIFEKDRNEKLKDLIKNLPLKQRTVIILKFYKRMKNKEIAKNMNIKEDTVKEYYKIAKKKLKTKCEQLNINL